MIAGYEGCAWSVLIYSLLLEGFDWVKDCQRDNYVASKCVLNTTVFLLKIR